MYEGFFRCFCYIRPKIFTVLRRAKQAKLIAFGEARYTPILAAGYPSVTRSAAIQPKSQ